MSIIAEVWDTLVAKIVAAVLAPIIVAAVYLLFRRVYRAFRALHFAEAALKAVAREQRNGLWTEGPGFWLKLPITRPASYGDLRGSSIPILLVAATKGGVGKTSLSGSLAAHFAMNWTQRRQDPNSDQPLRILVIDQDFQGSYTTMTVKVPDRYEQPSKANRLVSGELDGGGVAREAERISQAGMVVPLSIRTIPAYYDLAQAENRVLIEWLLPLSDEGLIAWLLKLFRIRESATARPSKDVRYLLAEALLDPQVQASFDLIIIDSPPRLTTSHIQGMCAASHLLVPTILDGLSGDAVARYLDQIATHRLGPPGDSSRAICPHLQPVGVVCSIVPNNPQKDLTGDLNVLRSSIAASRLQSDIVPEDCFIRHRPPYREHAGQLIAYASEANDQGHRDLRDEVDRLGDWLAPKLGAQQKNWKRRET